MFEHRASLRLLSVEGERVVAPALVVDPYASSKRVRSSAASASSRSASSLAPDLARELRQPDLRLVHVALHLDRGDRRLRVAAVVEALRVARVLPRLVVEPAVGARAVLDEAVVVASP